MCDSDLESKLDLFCYNKCDNDSNSLIKKCRGVVFNQNQIVIKGMPYTEEYTSKIINDPRLDYFHQLALGITFLKENDIIFDDLKTSNIMEKGGQAAIIDIGYSMVKGDPELPEIDQ